MNNRIGIRVLALLPCMFMIIYYTAEGTWDLILSHVLCNIKNDIGLHIIR